MSRGIAISLTIDTLLTPLPRISLSGGQKQRVNICRAIYCDTDIQIFDVRTSLFLRPADIDHRL